jgi:hypothetical protein
MIKRVLLPALISATLVYPAPAEETKVPVQMTGIGGMAFYAGAAIRGSHLDLWLLDGPQLRRCRKRTNAVESRLDSDSG